MTKGVLFSAVAALGMFAAAADAAQIAITTGAIAAYNNTTAFATVPFNASLNPATTGVVYEVPVYFQLSGTTSGQSFGNIGLIAHFDGGLQSDTNFPYLKNDATFAQGKGSAAYYSTNQIAGGSTLADGQILAAFPAGTLDANRDSAGKSAPFLIGYAYFDLPSNPPAGSHLTFEVSGWSTMEGGLPIQQPNSAASVPATITFAAAAVPEPASLSLLGLGAVGVLARRRREA